MGEQTSESIQTYNIAEESIVVYRSADNAVQLDVQLADETVWLTQAQIALLFQKAKSTISYHITNIFKEGELDEKVVVRKIRITTPHGAMTDKTQSDELNLYNLDVIISVGYRVHSVQGTRFRQWATKVLNNYLRYGYAISNRFERLEQRVAKTEAQIESFVHSALPPREGIFMDGQIFDAYEFVTRLIKTAKKNILLIDNYVDESVLTMMSEKASGVRVDIYTKEVSKPLALAADKFNAQYGDLEIHQSNTIHDRFLVLDEQTIYLIGASLKDAGKKLFAFTQLSPKLIEELKGKIL